MATAAAKTKEVKKPVKKVVEKETKTAKVSSKATETKSLEVEVVDTTGKKVGTQKLPDAVFGLKPNTTLLAQAIKVYETNISTHLAHTKLRGEVRGGGAKPWRQKGTGNARAGSKRSPLWVGGGITFGPRTRDVKLSLPQKMKHAALLSALSAKSKDGSIHIVSGIEKIEPKTKLVANIISKLNLKGQTLVVVSAKNQNVKLASRNIQKLFVDTVPNLNPYEIIKSRNIIFSKEAVEAVK